MRPPQSVRRVLVHAIRVSLFVAIILLVHAKFAVGTHHATSESAVQIRDVRGLLANVVSLGEVNADGSRSLLGADGEHVGYAFQTSPNCDHIIGFSGPTNMLLVFTPDDRIAGVKILSSGDTREHLQEVSENSTFLASFDGQSRSDIAKGERVDAVSGATLTSLAIRESIILRLSGVNSSLRFPEPVEISAVQTLFSNAHQITLRDRSSRLDVFSDGILVGYVLRSSPAIDNIVGYQGPTDSILGMDLEDQVIGIAVGKSYDNEPYVSYVRDDDYFRRTFNGRSLDEVAVADLQAMQVEGVSGATMTSLAVADGAIAAAKERVKSNAVVNPGQIPRWLGVHDMITGLVVAAAILIGFTSLRANKHLRIAFQLILIGYVGLTAGNLLSQAMIAGWAIHGVPWRNAAGLAMLAVAAFACPIFTKRNIYCSHLCPHGAVQQLIKRRIGYQVTLSPITIRLLKLVPGLLLLWCLIVVLVGLSFSLIDVEPFDAYLFPIAGWSTLIVALVGIFASLFVPMAYCRFGCPTGMLLEFLRYNGKSDRWTVRDWVATAYLGLAVAIWLV